MRYICSFSIGLAHDHHRPGDVTVKSSSLLESVKRTVSGSTPQSHFIYNVSADWTDPGLHRAFRLLEEDTGKKPVADSHFASHHAETHFAVRVERLASDEELNQSRWLYLTVPKLSMAKFKSVESDDSYVITKVSSKKKMAFGCTHTVGWMLLFSEGLKDAFLQTDLRSIDFRPVKLEGGSPSGLWQITSPVTMPPLAMTLLDGGRQPFTGDYSKGCGVNEGSYLPMILRYYKGDVSSLPDVDLILSAERLGWTSHNVHRMHVVSQRFRQVAEQLAPGMFSYGLVAVGEGKELQTRHTIPELAPPQGEMGSGRNVTELRVVLGHISEGKAVPKRA